MTPPARLVVRILFHGLRWLIGFVVVVVAAAAAAAVVVVVAAAAAAGGGGGYCCYPASWRLGAWSLEKGVTGSLKTACRLSKSGSKITGFSNGT